MITRYVAFLKRSIHTFPHDIAQPYHKVVDLILKVTSISLGTYGGLKIFFAGYCYHSQIQKLVDETTKINIIFQEASYNHYFYATIIDMLVGFGALAVAVLIGIIIIVRHLNETLPDHIYLRCFSTLEEKRQRLPVDRK